jgi:hypothetical protein
MKSFGQIMTEAYIGSPEYSVGSIVIIDGKKAKIVSGCWFSNGRFILKKEI